MNTARRVNLKIPGTKTSLQSSQLLISSGIPSLDHVIGGGIPVGSVFLIEEDEFGSYSNIMFKYFLAEGVLCRHRLLLATLDNDPENMLTELPSEAVIEDIVSEKLCPDEPEDMKIAWRYNNLTPIQSAVGSSIQFGHYFDVSKPIGKDALSTIDKKLWKPENMNCQDLENSLYNNLLNCIKNEIEICSKTKNENTNILRIGIQSLASPKWQMYEKHDLVQEKNNEANHLIRFLYCLRSLLRSTYATVLLTIPTLLFQNVDTVFKIRHSVDAAIKLDAFAGTDRESNPALKNYHGLFFMPKLLSLNTLAPYIPPTLDLAFKLKRKKFLIEKLHLPPELQESSEREQDDGSLLSCNSMKKRNLDF